MFTNEELEKMGAVAILDCQKNHIITWPATLRPFPTSCQTTVDGVFCGLSLTFQRTMVSISSMETVLQENEEMKIALSDITMSLRKYLNR